MGEKADLQGQKLSDTNNKKKGQIYVMLFVLSPMYWTGKRYLNLKTAKKGSLDLRHGLESVMLWGRGSVFASTEDGSLSMCLRSMWFESPRPPEML